MIDCLGMLGVPGRFDTRVSASCAGAVGHGRDARRAVYHVLVPRHALDGSAALEPDGRPRRQRSGVRVRDLAEAMAGIVEGATWPAAEGQAGQVGEAALVDAPLRLVGGDVCPRAPPHLLREWA